MSSKENLEHLQYIAQHVAQMLQTKVQPRPDGSYYVLGTDPEGLRVSLEATLVTPEATVCNISIRDPKVSLYDSGSCKGSVGLIGPKIAVESSEDRIAITDPRGECFIVGRNLPATIHHAANSQRE